jgi:hypothetical protein
MFAIHLAVNQLEGIAWSLRQMTAEDQECFPRYAYRVAREHPVVAVAGEIRELVDGLLPEDDEP